MGLITHGIPRDIAIQLASQSQCKAFVETGTFQGATTRWAAEHFDRVFTVERQEEIYSRYSGDLETLGNVHCYHADSRDALPQILAELAGQPALFWLDGHWSGGETAGASDECPLMDELRIIQSSNNDQHVILIDDARFYLSSPPPPHAPQQWPSIAEIVRALPDSGRQQCVQVIDDVIFIASKSPSVESALVQYAQDVAAEYSTRLQRPSISRRLKSAFQLSRS